MEDKIWACIIKRLSGTETEASRTFLDDWLAADAGHVQQYGEAKALWEMTALVQPEESESDPRKLTMRLDDSEQDHQLKNGNFFKYGIAAAFIAAVLFASFFYFSKGVVSDQQEWVLRKAANGEMTSLTLPDSSKVWLNAGTEIRFLKNFNVGKLRLIQLKGEAYFEVKHNQAHPFVVKTGKLSTTVHGTSFSIRAYPNEAESSVSVNSGKVGVQANGDKLAHMLLPNDKLSYKKEQFVKTTIHNDDVDSWTKGELIFEQSPLAEVFETISRKYNVQIDLGKGNYSGCRLTARFKNQPLSAVLKTLSMSTNIIAKQKGQIIYLKGGNCM